MDVIPLVLSGGGGSRLWPLSSPSIPKQFIRLDNRPSLYEQSLARVSHLNELLPVKNSVIVSSVDNEYQIKSQSKSLDKNIKKKFIFETEKEDTLRAIYRGLISEDDDAIFIVLPSDHLINTSEVFTKTLIRGVNLVKKSGGIVLIGVEPSHPSEKYGYIQTNKKINSKSMIADVLKFHEKPNKNQAKKYLQSESIFFWNSGVAIFKKNEILKKISQIYSYNNSRNYKEFSKNYNNDVLQLLPKISFDVGILEKADNIKIIPYKGHWSDLGSWSTVTDLFNSDDDGNNYYGDYISYDSKGNIIVNDTINPISIFGVKDHLILNYQNRMLVAPIKKLDDIKSFTDYLNNDDKLKEVINGDINVRPWGNFHNLFETDKFKLKKITVDPKQTLSLQYHNHRYESWFVISGKGVVELNGENIKVSKNQSIYITKGAKHRVTNPSKATQLIFVEIQAGKILSELDIVRLEDNYNRT